MGQKSATEPASAVTLRAEADAWSPLILASPHAGRHYRADFLAASRLDQMQLRRTEDAFVDLLFEDAPRHGVPLLCANFPRSWVDVNRHESELDPTMFSEKLPRQAANPSPRVAAGLGAIPRVAAQGAPIYRRKLDPAEAEIRLEQGWRPYHRALAELIGRTRLRFGWCVLIDCHSMPAIGGPSLGDNTAANADFVLGDAFGTSCRPDLTAWCEAELQRRKYGVKRNVPYAGGYVTRHYGNPSFGVHVLQLEVSRALYLNETTIEPHQGFAPLRRNCEQFVLALAQHLSQQIDQKTAAE